MSTQASRSAARLCCPGRHQLLLWMVVPLALTLWFSFQRYNLL
jgi:sorbitol/mannitol transport system permease protein